MESHDIGEIQVARRNTQLTHLNTVKNVERGHSA